VHVPWCEAKGEKQKNQEMEKEKKRQRKTNQLTPNWKKGNAVNR
jgi:hypothetical protein